MYLFIDCETTGLPRNWRAPPTDVANWPRVVQVAWARHDSRGKRIEAKSHLVKPDGFTIPQDAQRIHGITTEEAQKKGKSLKSVLAALTTAADSSIVLVAHNLRFDQNVIAAEYYRLGSAPPFKQSQQVCTMLQSTEFCRLPGPFGCKWPTLEELHLKLFDEVYEDAHDAGADVAACARCFFELRTRGVVSGPANMALNPTVGRGRQPAG